MIVAFTGAGISKPSGIPTYEEQPALRDSLSRDFFDANPEEFYREYWKMVEVMERAEPNPAHLALAEYNIPIITQNIDCLHQRAGSRKVAQIHGYYNEFICENCQGSFPLPQERAVPYLCPVCKTVLKPKVVLYGEQLVDWEEAVSIATAAKTMLVIGTSLQVYPAAYLPQMAEGRGAEIVLINERADTLVPAYLEQLARGNLINK
ncbi:MAG: NAD-dependent protein deacylase [Firmicutes bacterium]|nr:NAD-dependent protein deacylase [Bacillota bacterium]HOB21749.1 Sir2 family NAD-dependent protein deacetylase [Bacillota bacterium]HQD39257.1 Sir2 family NAD-dependent protein deacetylase [Bacillota bacterium]